GGQPESRSLRKSECPHRRRPQSRRDHPSQRSPHRSNIHSIPRCRSMKLGNASDDTAAGAKGWTWLQHPGDIESARAAGVREGSDMPRFMDYHDDLKLPQEAIDQIAQGTRDGVTDEFGVRQVELFHNADGKVYCLLEAPDEEAVRKHHAALNVPCGDVHE